MEIQVDPTKEGELKVTALQKNFMDFLNGIVTMGDWLPCGIGEMASFTRSRLFKCSDLMKLGSKS